MKSFVRQPILPPEPIPKWRLHQVSARRLWSLHDPTPFDHLCNFETQDHGKSRVYLVPLVPQLVCEAHKTRSSEIERNVFG